MIRAADIHRVPAMVRVPGHAPETIAAALDAGARGVLVPRVSTAAQAQHAVRASRYPPQGERGVGPGRAAGYGYRIFEYLAAANRQVLVAVQVETAEGLANVAEIAAADGVDVVFIGPGDLSVSIDAIGPAGAERLAQAIETVIGAALAHGKVAGIFCAKPGGCRQMGRERRQLLHPGQRHDVSRRRRRGRLRRCSRRPGSPVQADTPQPRRSTEWQRFQRVQERDTQWCEMPFVRRQHDEPTRGSGGRYGNVLETWIMRSRPVDDQPGVARFLDAESKNAVRVEVLDGSQPTT